MLGLHPPHLVPIISWFLPLLVESFLRPVEKDPCSCHLCPKPISPPWAARTLLPAPTDAPCLCSDKHAQFFYLIHSWQTVRWLQHLSPPTLSLPTSITEAGRAKYLFFSAFFAPSLHATQLWSVSCKQRSAEGLLGKPCLVEGTGVPSCLECS